MAALPLIVCDPASTWYDFAYPLSWSNDCEVAEVLSDIPVVSVGILMFGASVLLLVMKRVPISAIWLFLSILQAFIAAVVDLGQSLADGTAMNTTFAANAPAVRAREVLFALSIGFRFLFYWTYAAEPPRKDLSAVSTRTPPKFNLLILEWAHKPHSGSWTRWGLPGKLFSVGLLLVIITITALQIVWRVDTRFHQYSSVYATDAALELLVSFLLLLKLLLNTLTLNSPDNMIVHTFKECLVPISGLLVNIAIGVGNLLCFAFTESTVGRILQALEVYILALFVVVVSFFRHRDILLSTSSRDRKRRDVFTLPEPVRGSTFRITLPVTETPRISMILNSAVQNLESSREEFRRSARCSLNHVSSWVSSRVSRNRSPEEDEEVRLWNAEKVKVDPPYTSMSDSGTKSVRNSVSSTQEPKDSAEPIRDTPANHLSITSALDSQFAIARSMEGSVYNGQVPHPSQVDVVQRRAPSPVPSGRMAVAETPEASPIYGLSGIQQRPSQSVSESRTSLDELFRQQSQLDKSIEVLKLFSARTSANSFRSDSTASPRNVELSRSPSTGQRTLSSEVSLSSFPIPPWLTTTVPPIPSPSPSSVRRIRGNRQARFAATPVQDTRVSVPLVNSAPPVDIPSSPRYNSIPHSPFGEENESLSAAAGLYSRSDSSATEYNVTSFIGGLATPGEHRQRCQEKSRWPGESESSADPIQAASGSGDLLPRRLPISREAKGLPATPAAAKSLPFVRSPQGNVVDEPLDFVQYRPNDQTPRALPMADGTKNGLATPLYYGPRPARATDPAEGADRAQRAFVRPRPPPLIIRTYTEQKTGISHVQVLGDD